VRLVKMLGLAMVAAIATMAFIGAGSASAQEHKIVLCDELVTLCPNGHLWPEGTELEALAKEPKLHSSLGTTTSCEDSIVTGKVGPSPASPLTITSPLVEFGTLPTPKLGLGCTGSCTGTGEETIHPVLDSMQIEVEAVDKYYLTGTGLAALLKCPLVGTCIFRGENIKVPISHTGKHPGHSGENLPLANFEVLLNRKTTHTNKLKQSVSGSSFCPSTAEWLADYTLLLAKFGEKVGLAWPSLDK
jgi:hypothetical protein